ncbi:MAG: SpoIIE family protein phosphatase [Atopobiaceae bacterium]|nr:SpoIIE family protein phosphatase [Atopobiaceae bacterium]
MLLSNVLVVLQFGIATLLPVLASVVITKLFERTSWNIKMGYWPKQIFIGIIFGAIAVFGTEAGIAVEGVSMNVRDAAPLVAGLYFGGPAGIIAGVIGGVERWFAALWGRGMFTRLACSLATVLSGIYAALLRKHLFGGRRPSWPIAFAIGIVAEVVHMLLVFVTNLDEPVRAFLVARACTLPMVLCNAISVALSSVVLALMSGQGLRRRSDIPDISTRIQTGMLITVTVGFVFTAGFVEVLQTSIAQRDTHDTLQVALEDTKSDIEDASDADLLALARRVAVEIPTTAEANQDTINRLADELNLAEIHVVDENGIIVASSNDAFVGFDMASGKQAAEFLALLPGGGRTQLAQDYQPTTIDDTEWRKYGGMSIKDGFVQVSYDTTRFTDDLKNQISSSVANRHVGNEGLLAVTTERSELLATRKDVDLSYDDVHALIASMEGVQEGEVFGTRLGGISHLAMYATVNSLKVISLIPTVQEEMPRILPVMVTSHMEVLVFAALFLSIYVLIDRVVVRSIWQVNERLGEITRGDLSVEVDVRDSSEFRSLSDDINATVAALRDAIAAESARIESDLATAKAIQESALPRSFPPFPDITAFDIYASMKAAREVGGDFYDFFLINRHTLGFLIADVSGKGIPASLFMMAAKSELANYMKSGMDLAEAVHSANWNLCQGNDAGMFVTVWAATLDYETGRLTYVNAGHNPPLLRHGDTWEWLKQKGGLFLGTFERAKYRSHTLTLVPGDELLLYTDGVNEAFSVDEEEYGNERLEAFLAKHVALHPRMLVDVLRTDVARWAKGAEQSDDITMLCLEYGHSPEVSGNIRVRAHAQGLRNLARALHYEFSQIQCPDSVQQQMDDILDSIVTNVIQNAYVGEIGDIEVSYIYDANPASITMSVTDWGAPTDPLNYEHAAGEDAEGAGAGIASVFDDVDDAAYVRDDDRNVVAFRVSW